MMIYNSLVLIATCLVAKGTLSTALSSRRFRPCPIGGNVCTTVDNMRGGDNKIISGLDLSTAPFDFSVRGGSSTQFNLERAQYRLDGIEKYTIIMALFMSASAGLITSIPLKLHNWDECKESTRKLLETAASILFYSFSCISIMSSGFSTISFILINTYGTTALGMDLDQQFNAFLDATTAIRKFGFQSFRRAIFTFNWSLVFGTFIYVEKPGAIRWILSGIPALLSIIYGRQLKQIIRFAGLLIFKQTV